MEAQKELRELYKEELTKAWKDEKMQSFCLKEAAYIIEYGGGLYDIQKPRIQKDFCFGYGWCGVPDVEEERHAVTMCELAKTSDYYFMKENLKDINSEIARLENVAAQMRLNWAEGSRPRYMVTTYPRYHWMANGCRLMGYSIEDTTGYRGAVRGTICEDVAFVEMLIRGYEKVKEDFTKRLLAYLKRYGLSGVRSWTYLVD